MKAIFEFRNVIHFYQNKSDIDRVLNLLHIKFHHDFTSLYRIQY